MDASAFLELQEAWLHTNEPSEDAMLDSSALYSEINMEAYNKEFCDEGNGGFGAHTHKISAAEDAFHIGEVAQMMDRPFLDYINEMLMEELTEDHTFVQHDFNSYQAIVDGFYDIISEGSDPNAQSASNSEDHSEPIQPAYDSDDINLHAIIGEHSVPSGDDSLYGIIGEHTAHVQSPSNSDEVSFYDTVGKHSTFIPSSFSSDKLCVLSSNLYGSNELLRDVDAIHNEYGWIDHILHSNPSTPLATTDSSSSDGNASFVKNKNLNVEADYKKLYVDKDQMAPHESYAKDKQNNGLAEGKPYNGLADNKQCNRGTDDKHRKGHVDDKPRNRRADAIGKKGATAAGMSAKQKGKTNVKVKVCASLNLDLKELLVSCAQAVAVGDGRRAQDMLQELQNHGASPSGSGLQRVIHYFCEALKARMHGKGSLVYSEVRTKNRPSLAKLLEAYKASHSFLPYFKLAHYFANQSILQVAEGATRLHIIDYGILYGLQWPCLINALADRKEGPPKLVITGIEFPQPGPNPAERLEDTGRRLAEYAKMYNVPFEFHAIAARNWEDVDDETLNTGYGHEVLVLNCMNRLRNVLDDGLTASGSPTSGPRQKLLAAMHNLNPDIFVVAVLNAACNSAFFVARFREALNFYSNMFDMVETTWDDSPERRVIERDHIYSDILNIVACEGMERVQRPESYKQWQASFQMAGFEHVPIMPTVLSRSRSHVQNHYHKDFYVDHDSDRWMLLGWKGRTTEAVSTWKPRCTHD